jgi:hypothetical protein
VLLVVVDDGWLEEPELCSGLDICARRRQDTYTFLSLSIAVNDMLSLISISPIDKRMREPSVLIVIAVGLVSIATLFSIHR